MGTKLKWFLPALAPALCLVCIFLLLSCSDDRNTNPPSASACCIPDGSCLVLTKADCEGSGGQWHGPGVACIPNPCIGLNGACCLPNGTCRFSTSAWCNSNNGTWMGAGSTCVPNPCEP